jgi:hypothetical protein
MDQSHEMHYKHSVCAIWDELIKRFVPNRINRIIPTYLTYAR